jgi:hypothetical protein
MSEKDGIDYYIELYDIVIETPEDYIKTCMEYEKIEQDIKAVINEAILAIHCSDFTRQCLCSQ